MPPTPAPPRPNWGIDAYKHGVHDIQDDGTVPMESNRGQMALHYHLYALAPLIMLADQWS
jgi:poly(beta-D-mannuronate) lyase